MVQDLMSKLTTQGQMMDSSFKDLAKQALEDAWRHGREESYKDLEQKYEGLQSRIDRMNASTVESERQASADHSKVKQLSQAFDQTVNGINENSRLLRRLIHQLEKPVEISGKEVLSAFEEEAGTTVQKLVTKETAKMILAAKNEVSHSKSAVLLAQRDLSEQLYAAGDFLVVVLLSVVVAMVIPWWPGKLFVGISGIVGGLLYDKFKSRTH